MHNLAIARLLEEIADLLEIKGENPFKIRAYRRGAQAVSLLPTDVRLLVEEGRLETVDGIGKALAAKIKEWTETGEIAFHQRLLEEIPRGLIDVMRVPGIGPKVAKRLYDEIGVRDFDDLERAVKEQRVRQVRGLGPKAEKNIERGLAQISSTGTRTPIGEALPLASDILKAVRKAQGVVRAELGGSLRRWAETVGDVDIVASAERSAPVMEAFTALPAVAEVLARGDTKASVRLHTGLQVDLRVVPDASYASALHHFTGSKEHHVRLRELAQRRGYSISEYGLKHLETGEVYRPESEKALYEMLGLSYVPPELREGRGEIEAAERGALPDLIALKDVKGDLHVHSTWSDGRSQIKEVAMAAKERGWRFVAICDHSKALRITGGLTADDLRRQADEIRLAMEEVPGIQLLRGVEVDILGDGALDLDEGILSELDWVVASIHSGLRQDRAQLTKRLLRAIDNPYVDVIGHPTGRILGRRGSYEVDIEKVIERAATTHTALEINASPDRLDLGDGLAKQAKEAGVVLAVNTDAHHVHEFNLMPFGIAVARRAWLTADDVINSWDLDRIQAWRRRRL